MNKHIVLIVGLGVLLLFCAFVLSNATVNPKHGDTAPTSAPSDEPKPSSSPVSDTTGVNPVLQYPRVGAVVQSPLHIEGSVPAGWMFEGSFPFAILDSSKNIIAKGIAKEVENGSWMSGYAVAFKGSVEFKTTDSSGYVVLQKDNPSGDPSRERTFTVRVKFKPDVGDDSSQSAAQQCEGANGVWNAQYRECGGVSAAVCLKIGGEFNGCASPCRHDPNAQMCVEMCVQTCAL